MKKGVSTILWALMVGFFTHIGQASASAEQQLASLCMEVAGLVLSEDSNANLKAELAEPKRDTERMMWGATWYSQHIPIPITDDGWAFKERTIEGIFSHEARNLSIRVGAPFFESYPTDWLSPHMSRFPDLPKPSLSKFALLTRGLKITPFDVRCDVGALQSTVDDLAALFAKRMEFKEMTSAYFMPNGEILVHMRTKYEEQWLYLFETPDSDLIKKISIQHWSPGEFENLGFYIRPNAGYTYSNGEPAFFKNDFQAHEVSFPRDSRAYLQAEDDVINRIKQRRLMSE